VRHIRRPFAFDLMLPEWPTFKEPLYQTLLLSFLYLVIPLSLLHSSSCPCNHVSTKTTSLRKKKKNPANKQVTSKPRKTSFQQGNIFKYLDCYFSISLSFTCCRLNSLHISSPRKKEAFFFNFALFVGTSKEDFSNFHLYRKP